VHVNMPVMSAM